MKNKILALLAVAAVGSVEAAQPAATTDVNTVVASANAISVDDASMTLVLGTPNSSVVSYFSNDGVSHNITAAATAWVGTDGNDTVFPTLSANGASLRDSANAAPGTDPILVIALADTSDTLGVNLLATNVSGAALRADTYTATVTYTLN